MNNTASNISVKQKYLGGCQLYRQLLPCPVCNFGRLIDTNNNTRSKTYAPWQDGYLEADYYAKCPNSKCKIDIGIRKIE